MKGLEKIMGLETLVKNTNESNETLKGMNARVRTTSLNDFDELYQLQSMYKDLDYSKQALKDILSDKKGINLAIEDKNTGKIMSYIICYPASHYKQNQKNMNYTTAYECPQLKDNKAFYLELVETHPEYQGKGMYKISKKIAETAAYNKGYDRMYLHSVPEAVAAHQKSGNEPVECLPSYWVNPNGSTLDAYLMKSELNASKIMDNINSLLGKQDNEVSLSYKPADAANKIERVMAK
ncbi:MAG: GNAT family N-acetyltransferase [archaeon]